MSTRSSRNPVIDKHRARVAGLTLHHGPDAPVVAAAKLDLEAELLAAHIERVATQALPLSPERRDQLAALLRAGGTA